MGKLRLVAIEGYGNIILEDLSARRPMVSLTHADVHMCLPMQQTPV